MAVQVVPHEIPNIKKKSKEMTSVSTRKTDEPVDIDLLIVDDEADFRESACRYFNRLGFRVEQAEDGEEALNVSTNHKFDVVVLDIHMPGMNGLNSRTAHET